MENHKKGKRMKKIYDKRRTMVLVSMAMTLLCILFFRPESYANGEEDIYDVILFWGQSNMVGCANSNPEERYNPLDENSIQGYSKDTGIDKDILACNGKNRNEIKIVQQPKTVYEYLYGENTLREMHTNMVNMGERLYYQYDGSGNLTSLGKEENASGLYAMNSSNGINMIPEFGEMWYKKTGHKMVAVFCAVGGQRIEQFLPRTDENYPTTEQRYIYEAIQTKWNAAIQYLNDNQYTIGNKLYVVFQGESNIYDSKDAYKRNFLKIHNNMKKDLGITKGVIVETSYTIGEAVLEQVENKHRADEELIQENIDIILGSSYPYDRFVPAEAQYNACTTKVCYNERGEKITYAEAIEKASKSMDYADNTIHFTSASLSQIGREVARALTEVKDIELTSQPVKTVYRQNEEQLDVSGGKIRVNYKHIQPDVIPLTPNMVTGFDRNRLGTQTLTITYKGVTTTYEIQVKEAIKEPQKEVSEIQIVQLPNTLEYIQGVESIDTTGGKIKVIYTDESEEMIDVTPEMLEKFDTTTIGTMEVVVQYQGKRDTFDIKIQAKGEAEKKDPTVAKGDLPQTGTREYIVGFSIMALGIFAFARIIWYRKYIL